MGWISAAALHSRIVDASSKLPLYLLCVLLLCRLGASLRSYGVCTKNMFFSGAPTLVHSHTLTTTSTSSCFDAYCLGVLSGPAGVDRRLISDQPRN